MRRIVGLIAMVILATFGLVAASPAGATGAASGVCTTETGTYTFSPPLPALGDPTTVTPHESYTATIGGCSGLGVTGGTAVFYGLAKAPFNCTIDQTGPVPGQTGTLVYTWNTGQTTTAALDVGTNATNLRMVAVAGLFKGATLGWTVPQTSTPAGSCTSGPLTQL